MIRKLYHIASYFSFDPLQRDSRENGLIFLDWLSRDTKPGT